MSDANELLRINLHEVMSERGPERRRAAIERAYVEDVRHRACGGDVAEERADRLADGGGDLNRPIQSETEAQLPTEPETIAIFSQ
jgi:hypothetical protein